MSLLSLSLSEKLAEAQTTKKDISEDIEKKREYLESLQPKLNAVLVSTKPVQVSAYLHIQCSNQVCTMGEYYRDAAFPTFVGYPTF